jgi:chaperonin GroES
MQAALPRSKYDFGGIPMKLKPMADNVLLKQNEAQETTVSGIILATTNKEKPAIYEVVAVGPGTKDVTMTVKAGDRVVVSKFEGNEVKLDGVDYKFVKQDAILALVTD